MEEKVENSADSKTVETVQKKRGRPPGRKPGVFGPDNPPPGGAHRKGVPIRQVSQLLKDMRAVYNGKKEKDLPRYAPLRKLLEEDGERFLAQLGSLERAHRSGSVKAAARVEARQMEKAAVEAGKADEGSERVEELIDRLLKEWDDERGKVGV